MVCVCCLQVHVISLSHVGMMQCALIQRTAWATPACVRQGSRGSTALWHKLKVLTCTCTCTSLYVHVLYMYVYVHMHVHVHVQLIFLWKTFCLRSYVVMCWFILSAWALMCMYMTLYMYMYFTTLPWLQTAIHVQCTCTSKCASHGPRC